MLSFAVASVGVAVVAAAAALASPGDALQTATTTTTTTLCCSPIQSTHRQGRCEGLERGKMHGGCRGHRQQTGSRGVFFNGGVRRGARQEGLLRG